MRLTRRAAVGGFGFSLAGQFPSGQPLSATEGSGAALPTVDTRDWNGWDPTGRHDNTGLLQAAAAAVPNAGGHLVLPVGTCILSDTVRIRSMSRVRGQGASTIVRAAPNFRSSMGHAANGFFANWNASSWTGTGGQMIVDRAIAYEDLSFDWGPLLTGEVQSAHSISFVGVHGAATRRCTQHNGGNLNAHINCDGCVTESCVGTGLTNNLADHWAGCTNITVIDNTARMGFFNVDGRGGSFGISVSGGNIPGPRSPDRFVSSNALIARNTIVTASNAYAGGVAAIMLNAVAPNCQVIRVTVENNLILSPPGSVAYGVIMSEAAGVVSGHRISRNRFVGVRGTAVVGFSGDATAGPDHVEVSDNVFEDCVQAPPTEGIIQLNSRFNRVQRNIFLRCTGKPIYVMDQSSVVTGNHFHSL